MNAEQHETTNETIVFSFLEEKMVEQRHFQLLDNHFDYGGKAGHESRAKIEACTHTQTHTHTEGKMRKRKGTSPKINQRSHITAL